MKTAQKNIGRYVGGTVLLAIFIAIIAFVVKCSNEMDDARIFDSQFKQVAYYKSPNNERFFVYEISTETSIEDIKKHAGALMHTQGRITMAGYYFVFSSKNPEHARNIDEAMQLGFINGCVLAYWRYTDGSETFMENPTFD